MINSARISACVCQDLFDRAVNELSLERTVAVLEDCRTALLGPLLGRPPAFARLGSARASPLALTVGSRVQGVHRNRGGGRARASVSRFGSEVRLYLIMVGLSPACPGSLRCF